MAVAAAEVVAVALVVLFDVAVPTLVIVPMAGVSLLVRRQRFGSLGFRRPGTSRLVVQMLVFAIGWSIFQLSVIMPIVNHISGTTTDLTAFDGLEGNVAMLVGLLALSWTVAAVGEELAYRGYLQTRVRQLFRSDRVGVFVAVVASSALFGIAHSEQGLVGVVAIALDGIVFSVVRYRYRTLWASVLAHGFNNTLGFVAFFLVGPVHGFW